MEIIGVIEIQKKKSQISRNGEYQVSNIILPGTKDCLVCPIPISIPFYIQLEL
jgi:hypothetical protein